MMRVIAKTASEINDRRALLSLILLVACAVTALFYIMNLYFLIDKTVAIKNIDDKISALNSDVVALDAEYLKVTSRITPEIISSYGLAQAKVSMYIKRPAPTASAVNLASGSHEL